MLFSHETNLVRFLGLRCIQQQLHEAFHFMATDEQTLVVTASLPSLTATQNEQLASHLQRAQRILFWSYGDLLWNIERYAQWEKLLIGKEVRWVMASQRWKHVASFFLPEKNIVVQGHPVKHLRGVNGPSIRQHLGLAASDKLLLYAGRLNADKNLLSLWKSWAQLRQHTPTRVVFLMLGEWCDYAPYPHGKLTQRSGELQQQWQRLQGMFTGDVLHLPPVHEQQLGDYLLAADAVVSLSTFLEEDYGVLLRQAASLGRPILASDWGGHGDLLADNVTKIVPTRLSHGDYGFDERLVAQHMMAILSAKPIRPSFSENFSVTSLLADKWPLFNGMLATTPTSLTTAEWQRRMLA